MHTATGFVSSSRAHASGKTTTERRAMNSRNSWYVNVSYEYLTLEVGASSTTCNYLLSANNEWTMCRWL